MNSPVEHRLAAGLLSAIAIFTLAFQTYIDIAMKDMTPGETMVDQYLFFTNITVLLVALICARFALFGWTGPSLPAALALWMALTGVIYHVLLAANRTLVGPDILVNFLQHTLLPIAMAVVWFFFAPKTGLTSRDPIRWVIYPILYAIYGLSAGMIWGRYPYFFLDPEKTGWPGVGLYILGIGAVFLAGGYAIFAVAQRLIRRNTTNRLA